MLGMRAPHIYGRATLAEIDQQLEARARVLGVAVESYQSNGEGELVTRIQKARGVADALVINPGAYTHTSLAIADAIEAAGLPAVEVHLSNIHRREAIRRKSLIAPLCIGQVTGFGAFSYQLGLEAAVHHLMEQGRHEGTAQTKPEAG